MATSKEGRHRELNLIVGIRRAGKSTFLAEKIIKPYSGNVMAIKHVVNREDPAFEFLPEKTMSNWRQGARPGVPVKFKLCISVEEYKEVLNWIISENFKNGAIIVDDCTIFENGSVLTKQMALLVTMCRHLAIDLYLVYHGLTKLPIEQFIFVDHFIFFNTTDKIDRKKDRITDYETIEAAIMKARENYRSSDPKIKYSPVIIKMT